MGNTGHVHLPMAWISISQRVVDMLDVEAICQAVCDGCVKDLGFRMAWIGLVESQQSSVLRPIAQSGFTQEVPDVDEEGYRDSIRSRHDDTLPERGATGIAIQDGPLMPQPNIDTTPSYPAVYEATPAQSYGSSVALPLESSSGMIGALHLYAAQPDAFGAEEVLLLSMLAAHTAMALENARHCQAEQRQREVTEALRQAGTALSGTLNFEEVLDRILEQVSRVVPYDAANIMLAKGDAARVFRWRDYAQFGAEDYIRSVTLIISETPNLRRMQETGQPLVVSYVENYAEWVDVPEAAWIKSYAGAPLCVRNQAIGFLNVDSATPGFYSQADAELLQAFAQQAAIAIENARLYEEIRQRADELTTLNGISHTITSSLNLQETLTIITSHATRLLGVEAASVALRDEAHGDLWFAAASGEGSDFVRGKRLALGQGIVGWCAQHGEPVLVPNVLKDPRFFGDFDRESGFSTRSILCVPLQTKEQTIGAIEVMNKEGVPFGQEDLRLLASLAAPAAIAIENARLYKDLQDQMQAREEAQAQLVQSAKLAAIGSLVAGVTHELNNPLTSILGFAQLLQYSDIGEEARGDLDQIVAEARRATRIVRGLLDFARQRPPEWKLLQINDVMTCALNLLAYELRAHNIKCTTHLSPELPLTMADPHQLQQVFVNLIHNACQAMSAAHDRGHLTIMTELGASTFTSYQSGETSFIRIIIQDDGPGIPPDVLPRIFDPFFTTRPEGEGTGLGLSICHGIVSEHDGHIWAESEPGSPGGTTFFVELPLVPETQNGDRALDPRKKSVPAQSVSADPARSLMIDSDANEKTLNLAHSSSSNASCSWSISASNSMPNSLCRS
jgi:signal transduction histidine kinase